MRNNFKIALLVVLGVVLCYFTYKNVYKRYTVNSDGVTYYMYGEVKSYNNYKDLADLLVTMKSNQTLNIRVMGPGGDAETVEYLSNLMENTDGPRVVVYVDGSVYSADALMAFIGDDLKVGPSSYFMFHMPVMVNNSTGQVANSSEVCAETKGKLDRGKDAFVKCVNNFNARTNAGDYAIKKALKYLTDDELRRYYEGEDIYISGPEMIKRYNS